MKSYSRSKALRSFVDTRYYSVPFYKMFLCMLSLDGVFLVIISTACKIPIDESQVGSAILYFIVL